MRSPRGYYHERAEHMLDFIALMVGILFVGTSGWFYHSRLGPILFALGGAGIVVGFYLYVYWIRRAERS